MLDLPSSLQQLLTNPPSRFFRFLLFSSILSFFLSDSILRPSSVQNVQREGNFIFLRSFRNFKFYPLHISKNLVIVVFVSSHCSVPGFRAWKIAIDLWNLVFIPNLCLYELMEFATLWYDHGWSIDFYLNSVVLFRFLF